MTGASDTQFTPTLLSEVCRQNVQRDGAATIHAERALVGELVCDETASVGEMFNLVQRRAIRMVVADEYTSFSGSGNETSRESEVLILEKETRWKTMSLERKFIL